MFLPALLMQCYERQHIYRCFKDEQLIAFTEVSEAVCRIRSLYRYPECFAEGAGRAFACLSGSAVFIEPDKDSVVMFLVLVESFCLCKVCYNVGVNEPLLDKIGEHPVHILIRLGKLKRFPFFSYRCRFNIPLRTFGDACTEKLLHGSNKVHAVVVLHEQYRPTADLILMIKPGRAVDHNAVMLSGTISIYEFVLPSGSLKAFTSHLQELDKVCGVGGYLFFFRKWYESQMTTAYSSKVGENSCLTRSATSARLASLKRSIPPTRYPVILRILSNGGSS